MLPNLNKYNILLKGNFTSTDESAINVDRNIVTSGDINVNSLNIGSTYVYDQDYVLYGNNLQIEQLTSFRGDLKYKNQIISQESFFNLNGFSFEKDNLDSVVSKEYIKYSELSKVFLHLSNNNYVSMLDFSGSANVDASLKIKIGNKALSITNVRSESFSGLVKLNLTNVYERSLIVLNIVLWSDSVNLNSFSIDKGKYSGNLILNFIDPYYNESNPTHKNITIINSNISANIIAPTCNVIASNTLFTGSIVANSITCSNKTSFVYNEFLKQDFLPKISLGELKISSYQYSSDTYAVYFENNNYPYAKIYYTLDGSDPSESSSNRLLNEGELVFINQIGLNEIKAVVWSELYEYSPVSSTIVEIKCFITNPILSIDPNNKNEILFYTDTINCKIRYTLDGSELGESSNVLDLNVSNSIRLDNGFYQIRFQAYNDTCVSSEIQTQILSIDPDEPTVNIIVLDSTGQVASEITNPNFPVPDGFKVYNSPRVEGISIKLEYISEIENDNVTIIYTENGTTPTRRNGKIYTSPFYTKSSIIKAVAFSNTNGGVSDIAESKLILLNSSTILSSDIEAKSNITKDKISKPALFTSDIGWNGPTVITDDTVLYQNVVNILMTNKGERLFMPRFGVSILNKLFELNEINPSEILKEIVSELEVQEPRVEVDTSKSKVTYDERTYSLVIDLYLLNRITQSIIKVKLGYSVDSIR